jgi:hypothetical protein
MNQSENYSVRCLDTFDNTSWTLNEFEPEKPSTFATFDAADEAAAEYVEGKSMLKACVFSPRGRHLSCHGEW